MKTINNPKIAIISPVISVSLRNHQGDVIRLPEGFLSKLINDANEVAPYPSHEPLSLHINMLDTLTLQYRFTVMIGRPFYRFSHAHGHIEKSTENRIQNDHTRLL